MLAALARNWQVLAIRGAIAMIFGLMALVWPAPALLVLVGLFGVYALATGLVSAVLAFAKQPDQPRWLLALEAVAGVVAAIAAFTWPGLTAVTLTAVIGVWALVTGIFRIASALKFRAEMKDDWLFLLSGGLTALMGIMLLARPGVGALALTWMIGTFAILFGLAELVLAFRLRSFEGPTGKIRLWSVRAEEEVREKIKK